MKLTMDVWKQLVADHLRRAWESQWAETTDREMVYCGERLIEDGWTVSRTTWAVKQVVRVSYSPKGIMAALDKIDQGERGRDGNIMGGWSQSKIHLAENRELTEARRRTECYASHRDFPDHYPYCHRLADCCECPGVQRRTDSQTDGDFKPLSEILAGSKR